MILPDSLKEGLDDWRQEIVECRAAELYLLIGEEAEPTHRCKQAELREMAEFFRSKQLIEKNFVCAMVCSGPSVGAVDRLQAHVLKAVIYDQGQERPGKSVPPLACLRIRQLHHKESDDAAILAMYERVCDVLNDLEDDDSGDFLIELEAKRKAIKENDRAAYDFLSPFESILKRLCRDVHREPVRDVKPVLNVADSPLLVDSDSETGPDTAVQTVFQDKRKGKREDAEDANKYNTPPPSGPQSQRRSLDAQKHHSNAATARVIRAYMVSPMRWGVLSPHTMSNLVKELRAGLESGCRVANALMVISMFTGRPVSKLVKTRHKHVADAPKKEIERDVLLTDPRDPSFLALRSGLDLTSPEKEFKRCYAPSTPTIDIPLPQEIASCLELLRNVSPQTLLDKTQTRLSELREKLPQLTLSRIASAGYQWLYHNGEQRTLLDRLFGASLSHAVPLFYENMSAQAVFDAYEDWVDHLNGLFTVAEHRFTVARPRTDDRVGSQLTPDLSIAGELLRNFRAVTEWNLSMGESFRDVHNLFVVYTYLVLSIGTGLRPVKQAFESFADYGELTKWYYILDKASRRAPAPRFVPVPSFAAKQLDYYRQYLLEIGNYLDHHAPSRTYLEAVMANKAPYLFTLEGENRKPQPLTPEKVKKVLQDYLPLVLNFHRHTMRTELVKREVSDEVVQALMGHGDMGQEPHARYSALSMRDLEDAADIIEEVALELGLEPLRGTTVDHCLPPLVPLGKSRSVVAVPAQRDTLLAERKRERKEQTEIGRRWADGKIDEASKILEKLRDDQYADHWQEDLLKNQLKKDLTNEYAWRSAFFELSKRLDELNERHQLNIPIAAPPRRLCPPTPIRNQSMFNAHRIVQRAAAAFQNTLAETENIQNAKPRHLKALTVFSAACFGGLANPEALFAFARRLQSRPKLHLTGFVPLNLCWVEFHYATKKRNNIVVKRAPRCMRRFFVDGTTLILLVSYLKRFVDHVDPYASQKILMARIRKAVNETCRVDGERRGLIPRTMTFTQFARGAITVAERQPGVRLPNYLAEYGCGVIDSVSLPAEYFLHYLGGERGQEADLERLTNVGSEKLEVSDDGEADDEEEVALDDDVGRHILRAKALFAGLFLDRTKDERTELLDRMDAMLGESGTLPPTLSLLVRWLRDLLTERSKGKRKRRRLETTSVRRYWDWIGKPWLIQFDGIDLESLSAESWYERYTELIDACPRKQRNKIAGRLDHFHRYICNALSGVPDLPIDLVRSYRNESMVRPRIIPEHTFLRFVDGLLSSHIEERKKWCLCWIYVLCYRLGTRIGETSRILITDIEEGDDPLISLRANQFGRTKTKQPHQLRLRTFLTDHEWRGFHRWLTQRRLLKASDTEPLFAPPDSSTEVWRTTDLGRLFSELMRQVSGMHFSLHDCRHSAASRLIWLAENTSPPDSVDDVITNGRDVRAEIFTAAKNPRDRIWHLASVFNHATPETTFGSYVHFLDMLLATHLQCNQTHIPAKAVASLLKCPTKSVQIKSVRKQDGTEVFAIEGALSVAIEHHANLFDAVKPESRDDTVLDSVKQALDTEPVAPDPVALLQIVLEAIERGEDPKAVAIRHDLKFSWVCRKVNAARQLGEIRSRAGVSRLFSKERLKRDEHPLAPTRLWEPDEKIRVAGMVAALREAYRGDGRSTVRKACEYWLARTTSSRSGLRFHCPEALERFLKCFADSNAVPYEHWLVEILPLKNRSETRLRGVWRVFPGVKVRMGKRTVSNSEKYRFGIASLHLQKRSAIGGRQKYTSRALRYVVHILCIHWDIGLSETSQGSEEPMD